jgi:tRNA G26 N,N-dimethylase Trm1
MSIETHANRYKRYIVPLISFSIDYYVRIFVRVYTSASEVKKSVTKMGNVCVCSGCSNFHIQPLMYHTPHIKKKSKRAIHTEKYLNEMKLKKTPGNDNNDDNNNNNGSDDCDDNDIQELNHQEEEIKEEIQAATTTHKDNKNVRKGDKNANETKGKMKLLMGRVNLPVKNDIGNRTICKNCNSIFHFAGPMWIDPIFDAEFLKRVMQKLESSKDKFNSFQRLYGILTVMSEVSNF